MRAERIWQDALAVSERARQSGALVPLKTRLLPLEDAEPFVVRELLCAPPRHLRAGGPRPNPLVPRGCVLLFVFCCVLLLLSLWLSCCCFVVVVVVCCCCLFLLFVCSCLLLLRVVVVVLLLLFCCCCLFVCFCY